MIGGRVARQGEFPYIAALGFRINGKGKTLYMCSGTLINRRYIISAAHCFTKQYQLSQAILGLTDLRKIQRNQILPEDPQIFNVTNEDVTLHEKWSPEYISGTHYKQLKT